MSQSSDPDHFFQTTDSLETASRRAAKSKNNHGNPIRLKSKILALLADPSSENHVYVAEAAGTARRVSLEPKNPKPTSALFTGATTPLTSLALFIPPAEVPKTLFAGSWNKSIWSWDVRTRKAGVRYRGHKDFVKCVLCVRIDKTDVLISGGADSEIRIWDIDSGSCLQVLRGHTRGVQALAIDPVVDEDVEGGEENGKLAEQEKQGKKWQSVILFSTGSDRSILRWVCSEEPPCASTPSPHIATAILPAQDPPLAPHETTITSLSFHPKTYDLWTTSLDNSAKCLSREQNWKADTTLSHKDYVRCLAISKDGRYIFTGGREEDVIVWNADSGSERGRWVGHWDDITGLITIGSDKVVSASIDGTIRVWSCAEKDLAKLGLADEDEEEAGGAGTVHEAEEDKGVKREGECVSEMGGGRDGLTEEEERELAELMDDDD